MHVFSLALSLAATGSLVFAAPCDIYASGGTPCVAAHSTTRALYDDYNSPLYQVKRGSDSNTLDITPRSAGGVANADAQDTFCARTTCVITIIYDQSEKRNHLTQAPPGKYKGPEKDGSNNLASALGAPITLNGQKAYGVFIPPGTGYRNNEAIGTAKGNDPQGIYAIFDGTHYNGECCFDYGNAETSSTDTGDGHMEAIYFGDSTEWGYGDGKGPWIMGDLENGLFSGRKAGHNDGVKTINHRFITAIVKGSNNNRWSIRGGDAGGTATSGQLTTYFDGPRPPTVRGTYNPMHKEGAVILGNGGDNSNGAQGTFYEGVMTTGYPSEDTENKVQANIIAAKYATASTAMSSGEPLTIGALYSFQVTTPGYTDRYLSHTGNIVNTQVVNPSSTADEKSRASWIVRAGLANSDCYSFESKDTPGSFIRHWYFKLHVDHNDDSRFIKEAATFCTEPGLNGQGLSFRAWAVPTRYIRHYKDLGYTASNGGVNDFDWAVEFNNDVSFTAAKTFV